MNVSDLKTSKYLKKEDVGTGALATIRAVTMENVAMEGAPPDERAVLHFDELDKPMVLNNTNAQIIAAITNQSEEIERAWIGAVIVLYNDPSIMFRGKIVGGIRVRAPKPGTKLPVKSPVEDQGLPF